MPTSLKDLWSPYVRLVNCYGPSECSITTHYEIMSVESPVMIGRPIDNVLSYVLDENQRLVPIGVVGELYLGGVCLSQGYINLPEQTEQRFLPDPFAGESTSMFRTGDSARSLPDGKLQITGRLDTQVKVKGYRVELHEVAEAMMQHPRVVSAAAILKNKTHLVGYFSPADVPVNELRLLLSDFFPIYMVPDIWVGLHSLPERVNGKTDRKALEDMDVVIEVEDLSSSNENLLARVWEDILEIKYKGIRPTTSFYSHGGDNISAYQLVAKEKQVSRNLNSANAMKFPTLSEMEAISKIYNQERDLEETTVTESGAQNKEETESFWRTYLAGTTSYALTLGKADTEECTSSLSLIASVSMNKLTALAKEYSSTVAVMAKLAWAATLRKYTRSNDVVFGQVMTNRDIPVLGADRILGPLLSTVPCRVEFDDNSSLSSLVFMVQEQQGLVANHSHASLVDIKKWCGVEGDLYDTLFVYQNLPDTPMQPKLDDVSASIQYAVDHAFELIVEPNSTTLTVRCAFNPSNMTWRDARWILEEYDYTLKQMFMYMEPSSELSALWELSSVQNDVIISATRGIHADLPFSLLHHAFEERSRSHPDFPAIEFEGESLSYCELDTTANTLASRLVGLGIRCGCRVAVIMERCLEFPIGLLAVLKAGAATMPLDAMFPAARLSYVLSDASAAAVITTEEYRYRIDELKLSIP
ncbi:hypothetical protein AeNC1_015362, partial [Aphanomyces euteiches]